MVYVSFERRVCIIYCCFCVSANAVCIFAESLLNLVFLGIRAAAIKSGSSGAYTVFCRRGRE